MLQQTTPTVRRRLAFLAAGNCLLLLVIWLALTEGGSFSAVLVRAPADIAPVALIGFALTGIIFTGAIDLSVASALVLAGTVFGVLAERQVPPVLAFLGCMGMAWGIMAFNGFALSKLKIPAIIFTLAGLPFYRGLALILADVFVPNFSGNISVHAESYHVPGKEYPAAILLLGLLAGCFLELFSKRARTWLAVGNSSEGCHLMGLNPEAVVRSAFAWGGLFFALGTLVYVTRVQAVEPARMALGLELQVIAAVILGGNHIFGGEGSYLGTFLGALFFYLLGQLLVYAGATAYLQEAITGAVILVIIGMDCALHRRTKLMEELA